MSGECGKLYLVATPIGNLEDISYRALRMLREAELIAAEDTRNSLRLLNHFDIHTPMTSYHEYNKFEKGAQLIARMCRGETIALITDAGTPGISDPGEELVKMAAEAGIEILSVPGPAAVINALIISGLSTRRFAFEAFLPKDKKERAAVLAELKDETRTVVLYEAPHRLKQTLELLADTLGAERRISICRELTKIHEEVKRTTVGEAIAYYQETAPRGEYVLVIAGKDRSVLASEAAERWKRMTRAEHLTFYIDQGIDKKEAMKRMAKDLGVSKRDIYKELLEDKE